MEEINICEMSTKADLSFPKALYLDMFCPITYYITCIFYKKVSCQK